MKSLFLALAVMFAASVANAQSCPKPIGLPGGSVPLDVATVTTGGTAVTALNACNSASAGGWVATSNPAGICVDQFTTAGTSTGTPSTTYCLAPNQPFYLAPSIKAVSVNSTASGVLISGQGVK